MSVKMAALRYSICRKKVNGLHLSNSYSDGHAMTTGVLWLASDVLWTMIQA